MATSELPEEVPRSWIVVRETPFGGLFYEASWRHRERGGALTTMKRRLGSAWLERDDAGGYRRRRGRVKSGYLDEHAAIVAKDRLVRDVERELRERALADLQEAQTPVTFRQVAHAYLHWLEHVRDAKPTTLQDHRYLLVEPGTPYRRRLGTTTGSSCARSAIVPRPR